MKKRITPLIVALALLLAPAVSAFYEVQADKHDSATGTGIAVVHVVDHIYAQIHYIDSDGSGGYTPGDLRTKTVYFRL
jgi:hypothetical protein